MEHIEKKLKIEEAIAKVDDQIAELERLLKIKIDQKHSLEEQREEKVRIIRKVNEEFEGEIDELTDLQEKFERKRMVNEETRDALTQEKEELEKKQNLFEQKLKDFDTQITGFVKLSKRLRAQLRKEEKTMEDTEELSKEYERKLQVYKELNLEISQCQQEVKSTEWEIDDFRQKQSKQTLVYSMFLNYLQLGLIKT